MSQSTSDFVTALQALAAALVDSCADPADSVRLAQELAIFAPAAAVPGSLVGQAMGAMQSAVGDACRRAAVVALARASVSYQPASYDDAVRVRQLVCDALDAEITIAGDQGEDKSYNALRALRRAVVEDFEARGANLAPIKDFSIAAPLPALVVANRLYGDAARADELVTQANPVHPLFMPTRFKALAE